ncbi:pyruvate kinase [Dorcoceras hygrometricum]|uniref:Pyruvate kinase n=1 Tax=Dorcoceras hygrometricum TaxID=472368 RepID=A0A2Z7BQ13_9LAMI|nr:pyruvate kinase [Dorcoceras hygrometricum]
MAQVVATRLIHGAYAPSPSSGSVQSRSEKLKSYYGFDLKVLAPSQKSSRRGAIHVSVPVSAIRSSPAEPEVIPVTPEDVVKGPEVRSGDLPQPIELNSGQEFTFTIRRGVGTADCVSVNYDDFVNDVEVGDMLLVDGGMMSLTVKSKSEDSVKCEVVDGGELKSRRHLNVRGKSATLPSITEKDWDDIKFGVDNKVDFYAVSFVKDAAVVHELKNYLKDCGADIHVIVKIESADSIPNLHSIITASDGAMVARGDLGAELPIEEVPLLQEEIIRICRSMGKAVIVATNMLESMIVHPTPTRAEVSDIAIAVREGADAVMLSGETAHGKFPLKAVKVMHTVSLRTEATIVGAETPPNLGRAFKNHMSEMFAFHATMMSNTIGTSIVVFTRTGFMAILLSHYRPSGTIFAFTNEKRIQQRLALYQGICPIYMEFSSDAEETFADALVLLKDQGMVKEGEPVALVQSGRQPIWSDDPSSISKSIPSKTASPNGLEVEVSSPAAEESLPQIDGEIPRIFSGGEGVIPDASADGEENPDAPLLAGTYSFADEVAGASDRRVAVASEVESGGLAAAEYVEKCNVDVRESAGGAGFCQGSFIAVLTPVNGDPSAVGGGGVEEEG